MSDQRHSFVKVLLRNKTTAVGVTLTLLIVLSTLFAPWLTGHPPYQQSRNRLDAPSGEHWFGTDQYGRDIASRVLHGGRISLGVALGAVIVGGSIGVVIGLLAGYHGGRFDRVATQIADFLLSFPSILVGVILLVILGPGITSAAIAIGIALIPRFLRVVRAEVLALREIEFVDAARVLGASDTRIIVRHVLPNVMGSVATTATLWVATAIRLEAGLSFLGLGAQPPTPSWGLMLKEGMNVILFSPWLAFFPGLAIFVSVLSINMVGDGLRDAVDPRAVSQ